MKEQVIAVNPKLIWKITDDVDPYSMENGYRMTKELLQSGEPFTAVYAIADTLAIGACRALHEAGKRIPADVSVAGFDGIPLGEYYIPDVYKRQDPSLAMSPNIPFRERLKARKGRVVKITENERGFYVTAEFDDDN